MATSTTPDGIVSATTGDNVTIAAATTALANSVQTALSLRQRFEFVWANAAARTSQTGMVTGSTGYQVDTKSEYIYESSTWRLKTPHAEFTTTISMTTTFAGVGVFALDSSTSTSSVMATAGATSGQIVLTDPGIYALTATMSYSSAPTSATMDIATSTTSVSAIVRNRITPVDIGSVTIPNYRTTASNFSVYVNGNASSATTCVTRFRVTRLG